MRSLIALLVGCLWLSGCAPQPDYEAMADASARAKCDMIKTQTSKLTPWVQCYAEEVTRFYGVSGIALPEEKRLILMKSKALAPKVDDQQISEDEFNFEISAYQRELRQQEEQIRLQRERVLLEREQLYNDRFPRPTVCDTKRRGDDLRTYCY